MDPAPSDDDKSVKAIKYSISKGQNHLDTAEMYGHGHSEELVGQAISGEDRKKLFIASKVHRNYTKSSQVHQSVEAILKRLKTDYLDLIYLHSYWDDENMQEYLEEVNKVVDDGLARSLGVSNWTVENLQWGFAKTKHKIVANQMNYNILHQEEVPQEMKEMAIKEDFAIVAYRPIERKLLADQCEDKTVLELAKKYNKTPAQIAINWLIAQENTLAITKSTDTSHIDENLGALEFEMDKEDHESLNSLS